MSQKPTPEAVDSTAHSPHSYEAIATVLNSLDALVYVADMQTYEVLFFNDYGSLVWGAPGNKKCYELLQKGQTSPCAFCTNHLLLDAEGKPAGVYVWEFQNTRNERWYQCHDQVIRWTDGRLVRLEIATDITDLKQMEQDLAEAKERAERLADTDDLTGLNNRRAFFRFGDLLLKQALRQGQPLAMIMFDLDFFKRVNDQWGHAAGDEVLARLADVCRATVRESDLLGRLGGEEFGLVLPGSDGEHAMIMAERLRHAIEQMRVHTEGAEITPTASLGVAVFDPRDPAQASGEALLDRLLNCADRACLRAKGEGRNRVCMAEAGMAQYPPPAPGGP